MNKEQAIKEFLEQYYGVKTLKQAVEIDGKTTVRCAFCDYTDYLCKDKRITEKQYNSWTLPSWIYK